MHNTALALAFVWIPSVAVGLRPSDRRLVVARFALKRPRIPTIPVFVTSISGIAENTP